jgi:Acetohydroxy acid isomeroreductase, NADPH-binding domain
MNGATGPSQNYRTTLKMTLSPSSGTAHRAMARVSTPVTTVSMSLSAYAKTERAGGKQKRTDGYILTSSLPLITHVDIQVPGETLFTIEEAIKRGTIVMNLLSDAAQSQTWPTLAPLITKGKTLYFSHGFSVVYKEDTHVIPPPDVDVILVAPKGSGRTVRTLFKQGRGINSSVAVFQDVTGKAKEKAVALGVGIGSGYMYETTFEKEVYSDLYGERGVVRVVSPSSPT